MHYTSGCKINLGLRILDKREDGYHNLETVFYPLDKPFDELYIEKTEQKGAVTECETPGIDLNDNTLTKAYRLYDQICPLDFGIKVKLVKHVPHGAGLGGGSANAACILSFLQEQTGNALDFESLVRTAAKVGADVPFFLYNKPCFAEGIGDILRPADIDLSPYVLLLVMPDIKINTAWAFKNLTIQKKLLTTKTEKAIKARSPFLDKNCFFNDFEDVVFKEYESLAKTKETMLRHKAVFASLSGTGSSLYGLYENKKDCLDTVNALSEQSFFSDWKYLVFDKKS